MLKHKVIVCLAWKGPLSSSLICTLIGRSDREEQDIELEGFFPVFSHGNKRSLSLRVLFNFRWPLTLTFTNTIYTLTLPITVEEQPFISCPLKHSFIIDKRPVVVCFSATTSQVINIMIMVPVFDLA